MAQQNSTPRAVAQAGTDRVDFISGQNAYGFDCKSPVMGSREVDTTVCVLDGNQSVMLVLRSGGFALHNSLTPEEARTLARALNLAADHAQERAEAAQAADWLASNAAAQKLCGVVA